MTDEMTVLCQEFEQVTGRALTDPSMDIFELGLDSITILSLLSRLREAGYTVTLNDLVDAESMSVVAKSMAAA